jgi:hypothetical protein
MDLTVRGRLDVCGGQVPSRVPVIIELAGVGRSNGVVPAPVLKDGYDPSVEKSLDPDARDVAVLRPIGHHDD